MLDGIELRLQLLMVTHAGLWAPLSRSHQCQDPDSATSGHGVEQAS